MCVYWQHTHLLILDICLSLDVVAGPEIDDTEEKPASL